MKVLILSSNNGGGHNAVAKALQECFAAHADVCEIRDCLSFISDSVSETVAKSHNFVYRHTPKLFNKSYLHSEQNAELFKENHSSRRLIELGKYHLGEYLQQQAFDLVLCTHVFAAMMLSAARKQYSLSLCTAIVETDYANTPGSADNDMDLHFLPDASLLQELVSAGVDEQSIVVSGIPVRKEFLQAVDPSAAKRQCGLDPALPHVLIMGGSMGCGPIPDLLNGLYLGLEEETEISVICGTNTRMLESLEKDYGHLTNIHLFGYTPQVSLLLDSADLLITKPGGVTVTEAAVKAVPMVLIDAVGGCETHNRDFFTGAHGALSAETPEQVCRYCVDLLDDEDRRHSMAKALRQIAPVNAAELIYETTADLVRATSAGGKSESTHAPAFKSAIPTVQSSLRHGILEMPKVIYEASGIVINGRRIKSLVFTTDLAIIRNCDADAVFAVYPFTPQQAISDAIIKAAYIPVFCGVGGGATKGLRTIGLAKDVEGQGAMGVVLNAPVSDLNLAAVAKAVDIPVIITVVSADTDVERRLLSGASILNVAGAAQTPKIVEAIRRRLPDVPIIASGGNTEETIRRTIQAGANAITFTPPTTKELFKATMAKYREL